jgi:hypothetical protein
MFPQRISIGIRSKTIPNPALEYKSDKKATVFQGKVANYNFKKQQENFLKLQAVLAANGTTLDTITSARYVGDRGENTKFVAVSADGKLMWYKYVGFIAQSGQNHVFVCGMRIKLSYFLEMAENEQRALLSGDKMWAWLVLGNDRVKRLDEDGTLWN